MKKKAYIFIIIGFIAVVFYCLNAFVPYYDDDIWYALRYVPDETLSPITDFSDILISQYHHYMDENSRALIHITLQSILAILPDWGFDLLNTVIFLLFVLCATRYTSNSRETEPMSLLLTVAGICFMLPDMDYLYYWAAGSLNYLWTSLATLCFLQLWQHTTIKQNKGIEKTTWLYGVFSFCCAFSHEAFALPAGCSILIYMLAHYRRIGYNTTTIIAIAYGLGCLAILIAPGLDNKTQNIGYADIQDYLGSVFFTLRSLYVAPTCAILFIASLCRKSWRKRLWQFVQENRFLLITVLLAFVMVFSALAGAQTRRIYYAAEFFALLLMLKYLNHIIPNKYKQPITIALSIVLIAWGAIVVPQAYNTGKQHYTLIDAHRYDDDGIIFLPEEKTSPIAQPWIIDLHRFYYLSPEAEWRGFVTPLTHLQDTLPISLPWMERNASQQYKLYNKYIQIVPYEMQTAIERPQDFFIPANKIPGHNPFYGNPQGDYIITPLENFTHDKWQWHYHPASWREPAATLSGFLRRLIAPGTFPTTEPVMFPDTIAPPGQPHYVIIARPIYRTLKSIEPTE